MNQKPKPEFQGRPFNFEETDGIIQELYDRTDSGDEGYNSIKELGGKTRQLEEETAKEADLQTERRRIDGLENAQVSGFITFRTEADMIAYPNPSTTEAYRVTNDPDPSKNGTYSWIGGTNYEMDAFVVANEIDPDNTSAGVSGRATYYFINKIRTLEDFLNEKQNSPSEYNYNSNTSLTDGNKITISKNGAQSKFQIDNNVQNGNKYIMLISLENAKSLNPECTRIRFFNFSQSLFSYHIPTDTRRIIPVVFTASASGVIQVIAASENDGLSLSNVSNGEPLVSFRSYFIGCIEWSQEKEDFWMEVSENYRGGVFEDKTVSRALVANRLEGEIDFPEHSFATIGPLADKVKLTTTDSIVQFNSFTNAITPVTNEVRNGKLVLIGGKDYTASFTRMYCGFDVQPSNYEFEDKSYIVVLKGKITANNVRDFRYDVSSGKQTIILQDLEDDVEVPFEAIVELKYSAGTNSNQRYSFTEFSRKDESNDTSLVNLEFDIFSLFEKIEGATLQDYLKFSDTKVVVPKFHSPELATEDYVNTQVGQSLNNVSKLSANDVNPLFDIEMLLSGGQSLNVGGGASSGINDFKNTPSFIGGTGLFNRPFTSQSDKDAFFGSEFVLLENNDINESYPPINASLTTVLSLLQAENNVDVTDFQYRLMPFAWGVSGSSITTMIKGTTAYNNMIEVVTKAKEFANKKGKTFGVRAMNWYHGEADRFETKQWYYDRLSQLFIDVNTDIKAITGQSESVEFFTYQTSPWLGRNIGGSGGHPHINIQEAQVQVANDFDNVHLAGAMYQFSYSDFYHPSDRAVVGLQTGVAIKRVVIDNEPWVDFKPLSHEVLNADGKFFIRIKFDVPVKPMVFDITGDTWSNPKGKQPNFGFEVLDGNGNEMQIEEPFIIKGDTVVLTTNINTQGATVRYAVNGHDGGGNLRDSQNITVRNKGVDYLINNFCVAFSEYSL